MTSHFVSWAAKHKRIVALALVSLFLFVQIRFVGPYVTQLDSYRNLREGKWQWPLLGSDRGGQAPDSKAPVQALPTLVSTPPKTTPANVSLEVGAALRFNVQRITPAAFPAAVDTASYGGTVKTAEAYYVDVDPHRGELPTHLRALLEREPLLSYVPWPPKAPEISSEVWPRRNWHERSKSKMEDAEHPEAQPLEADWREPPYAGWRPPLENFTASAGARPLPKVQYNFENPSKHSGRSNDRARDELIKYRQRLVRNAFLHAWEGYKKHAWGHDELKPVTKQAHDNFNGWGATIVDALDTLLVMDLPDQYDLARQHVRDIDFTLIGGDRSAYGASDGRVPVFETSIRYLGGFLSAYDLSGDTLMRDRAEELAQLIMPSFETGTGVPVGRIKMPRGAANMSDRPFAPPHSQGSVVLAEAGSMLLEFTRLWQVTGNRTYFDRVQRTTDWLDRNMTSDSRLGTLFPATFYPERPLGNFGSYRLGGMADSYYEYLIKEHQLLGGRLSQYPRMYSDSINSAKIFLMQEVETVPGVKMLNIGERSSGHFTSKLEHLTCFSGGMLGLGAKLMEERHSDIDLATAFTETCWWAYNSTATGLGPENVIFYDPMDPLRYDTINLQDGTQRRGKPRGHPQVGVYSTVSHYLNRPETIESVLYMWRITGDEQWQERGWQMFTSWVYHCMTEVGFSAVSSVHDVPADWTDSMESFTFAETFKYYYLLFSPPDLISLDEYVFTTEAHPLLLPKRGKWGVPGQGSKKFWSGGDEAAHRPAATSGQYSGGEGGEYGGLTNNQKRIAMEMWERQNAKTVVARSLVENLSAEGIEGIKTTLKGLLGSVDWDRLTRGQIGNAHVVSQQTVTVVEGDEDDAAGIEDDDDFSRLEGELGPDEEGDFDWSDELLSGSHLVEYSDGTIAVELDESTDEKRHLKVLAAAATAAAAAAAQREAEAGQTDSNAASWITLQQTHGDRWITTEAAPSESVPHQDPRSVEKAPGPSQQDEEAAERQRLAEMQAARFRSKGVVGERRSEPGVY